MPTRRGIRRLRGGIETPPVTPEMSKSSPASAESAKANDGSARGYEYGLDRVNANSTCPSPSATVTSVDSHASVPQSASSSPTRTVPDDGVPTS